MVDIYKIFDLLRAGNECTMCGNNGIRPIPIIKEKDTAAYTLRCTRRHHSLWSMAVHFRNKCKQLNIPWQEVLSLIPDPEVDMDAGTNEFGPVIP